MPKPDTKNRVAAKPPAQRSEEQKRLDHELWRALNDGDLLCAQKKLAQGANPNAAPESGGPSLLMAFAREGRADCVRALLADARCDPMFSPEGAPVVLFYAVAGGCAECVRLLATPLAAQATAGPRQETALMSAARDFAPQSIVDLLIPVSRWGAVDERGDTAMEIALRSTHWAAADALAAANPSDPICQGAWRCDPPRGRDLGLAPWASAEAREECFPRFAKIQRAREEARAIEAAVRRAQREKRQGAPSESAQSGCEGKKGASTDPAPPRVAQRL